MSGPPQFPGATHVGMQALQQQQQQLSQQMGQQMNQHQMNQHQQQSLDQHSQHSRHPGAPMSQHQQQSLDQHSQHSQHPGAPNSRQVMAPSGMNLQGSALAQGSNMLPGGGGGYTEIDRIQKKLLSLSQNSAYQDQFEPRPIDQFEPRPIDPNMVSHNKPPPSEKEEFAEVEVERIAPMPTRREPRKPAKRTYKREGSDSSLQVDTIFSTDKNNNAQSSSSNNHNNNTKSSNQNHKMAESHNLSIMSLSVSDMNHGSTDHYNSTPHQQHDPQQRTEPEPHHSPVQPEGLATMFNNSMRFSGDRRKPARRSGSNEEDSSVKCFNLDMSVATLGDHMSEMGDMSYARMNDSQANMSFSNVFEETERDLYVNGG
jgi:hypothetical protein